MFEHASVPGAYDRSAERSDARLIFVEDNYAQGAELNEVQSIAAGRTRRVGDMIARDGARIDGAAIVVSREDGAPTGSLILAEGRIYVTGDVRPVAAAEIADVAMVGTVSVGVRLSTTVVTWEDDESLLGLAPGTVAEGEPGAAREIETLAWALADDDGAGVFHQVYQLVDGAVIDQSAPPDLTGVKAVVADYDHDAHGSYIVEGCEVTALGLVGSAQVFSIQPGVANIMGWKRRREYALRHAEIEAPDLETISAETQAYPADGVITLREPPAETIDQVVIQKEVVETVVRGSVPGGTDALTHTSIVSIVEVKQGATTFAVGVYALAGDGISWAPAGAEPAASSTYQVKYRYNVAVVPDAITARTVTVSGGVVGTPVLLTYRSRLPRIDLLCLQRSGETAYVKGVSARKGAVAPLCPTTLLKLAEIHNDWLAVPSVVNDGTHSIAYDKQWRFFDRLVDMLDSFNRLALESDIRGRAVAAKGIFTDPLTDDWRRDQGEPQTAAIVDGCLVLAVDEVGVVLLGTQAFTLPWVEEVVVTQPIASSAMPINPYSNLVSMPADMKLEPPVDFWTSRVTSWTSAVTKRFTKVDNTVPAGTVTSTTTITETVGKRTEVAETLRQIPIRITIDGFAVGEHLRLLTFDGVNIKPAGVQTADAAGQIVVTVPIPAGIPAGTRRVRATGEAGSYAEALFVGQGTILVDVMRRVTLVTRTVRSPTIEVEVPPKPVDPEKPIFPMGWETNTNEGNNAGGEDPLAQTYTLTADRMILGLNFQFAAIGNRARGVRVQLAGVSDGDPTAEVEAQAFIGMATRTLNSWVPARWAVPVHQRRGVERAMVILTDDTKHAVRVAKLGDIITVGGRQQRVASQPYTVGTLLASSNRSTWTPIQDADLTMQIIAAKFTATTRVVVLGTIDLDAVSDLVVSATIELPSEACSVVFEVVRASGAVHTIAADQTLEFTEFVTETVTLRARLRGTETLSPVLWPCVQVGLGRIRTAGTYVTKVFKMGTGVDLAALYVASLPAGSAVAVARDAADGIWSAVPVSTTETLDAGWVEPKHVAAGITAPEGRVKLTLTGGPAARPKVARPRAYTI